MMKFLPLVLIGLISALSCSESHKEGDIKVNKVKSQNDHFVVEEGTIPADTSEQIWLFYHEVGDEMKIVTDAEESFYDLLYKGKNNPTNCDSLILVIEASVSKIKKMHHPGNEPEIYSEWTSNLMLNFSKLLETFKAKEYLLTTKPKSDWSTSELNFFENFMKSKMSVFNADWLKWRDDAGRNYLKANEEYVGKQ